MVKEERTKRGRGALSSLRPRAPAEQKRKEKKREKGGFASAHP